MSVFSFDGIKSTAASAAGVVAALAGQAVSMLSLTLTQTTGLVGLQMTTGARAKLGSGTNDFLTSDGANTLTAAGNFTAAGSLQSATGAFSSTGANVPFTALGNVSDGGTAVNAIVNSAVSFVTAGAKLFSVRNNTVEQLGVDLSGKLIFTTTDSTGSPGNATINKPSGKSSIAAAAQTCVISNSTVTATSSIHITPLNVDSTAPLLKVSNIGASTFTVTSTNTGGTATNATANIAFCWWVLNA